MLLLSFINGALPLAIKRLTNYEEYKHPRTAAQRPAYAVDDPLQQYRTLGLGIWVRFWQTSAKMDENEPTNVSKGNKAAQESMPRTRPAVNVAASLIIPFQR